MTTAPVVNYLGSGTSANFANDLPFPTQTIGADFDDFAIEATSSIIVPSAGNWTFGVNSDDGFLLELTRDGVVFTSQFAGPRGPANTLATFNLPSAGSWSARLVMFERGGGAQVEFFAAPGSFTSFSAGAFRIVGDTASGGLEARRGLTVATNVQTVMLGINASAYVRIPFNVTDPATFESLSLKMRYDDGFIAYLNGVEVARRNAPASPAFNSSATATRTVAEVGVEESIGLSNFIYLLTPGNNVLAIQGLNASASNGSFLLQPKLIGVSINLAQPQYFATPTPGTFNSDPFLGVVDRVTASAAGGFFSAPINVTLATPTPGATIRYTLDGSTPTATNGLVYNNAPINVSGTTTLRAGAFKSQFVAMPTISRTYLFLDDVVNQSPTGAAPPGWPATWGGNVVDYGMDPDILSRETVQAVKNALLAIPTLAVSTDLENLFGAQTGIYSNAFNDGREWERPASLELINPDGSQGFQVNAGIRIRGGFSRSDNNPKHSFRFFFRGEYGDSSLNYPMFGTEGATSFSKLDLRTAQNYSWSFGGDASNTFIADIINRETQRDMGQPYTRSNWYHLYIGGQYWGLFQTQERAEAEFAATYFGGSASNYDVLKPEAGPYIVVATDGNDEAYRRLWDAATTGFANNADYLRVQGKSPDGSNDPSAEVLLDVDNLVVYMINILYAGNLDAPISNFLSNNAVNNFFAVRDRTARDGFKFFLHDSEHTLLPWRLNENRNGPYPAGQEFRHFNPQWLHQRLMENNEYRMQFADVVQKSFFNGGPLTVAASQARYQNQIDQINLAIIAESARWGDAKRTIPLNRQDWLNATANVRDNYLPQRAGIVLNQWRANGLFPTIGAPNYLLNGAPSTGGQTPVGSNVKLTGTGAPIYYMTDGSDPRLFGGGLNPAALVYDPQVTTTNLITAGSSWRYLDNGTDPGATWTSGPFNDATWKTGDAELGYGDGDEVTVIAIGGPGSNANNRAITSYFRRSFNVANAAAVTDVTLRLKRDDGAVVYVNGVEVVRSNMPSGPITTSTLASSVVAGADESTFYEFTVPASVLVTGTNVIAVEVHQVSASSSDVSFDLSLASIAQSNPGLSLTASADFAARARTAAGVWSPINRASFVTAVPATAGNLVVTELMYNPPPVTTGELVVNKEDYEFIELRNIGTQPISLAGVRITDGVVYDFTTGTVQVLNPGQVVVVAKNVAAFRSRYGNDALVTGQFGSGNLSNGGEAITIVAADNAVIQTFTYDDAVPWPTSPDGLGPSLTIKYTNGNYNAGTNWRPSYLTRGTPGYIENSIPDLVVLSTTTLPEDQTIGTVVGNLSTLDPDLSDSHTYQLVTGAGSTDNGKFTITGNVLTTTDVLRFAVQSTYLIRVRATDPGGLFVDQPLTVTVTPVANTPTITSAATVRNAFNKTGLVITRNSVDGNEVTHYQITAITGGTLFQNDGVTAILTGAFITAAQGTAGLKFLPTANSLVTGSFGVQAATAANAAQLGGTLVTANVTVSEVTGVQSIVVNAGRSTPAQRSMVTDLTVTFGGIVSVGTGAFEVRRIDQASTPIVPTTATTSVVGGRTVVRLTFSGSNFSGGSLVDGRYQLQIRSASVTDSLGYEIDGDANGTAGGDRAYGEGTSTQAVDNFFRLYGDSDGSGDVGVVDLARFRLALGRTSTQSGYQWYFDSNNNNAVDGLDLFRMRLALGKRIR